ncbi:MAG TPA: hypothetical protein VHO28_12100 [Ignavibacteriales bacterium]|nr:hypothetical protein [Ignavibacteriales bacterium]
MNTRKLLFIFLLAGLNIVYSQNALDKKGAVGIYFEGGYNTYDLKEISNFYTESVDWFVTRNMPVKTQKLFPGNGIFGGGMSFNVEKNMDVRFGLHYTETKASSSYSDNSGSIDVSGEANSYNINIGIQRRVPLNIFITPLAELNMGVFLCRSSVAEKVAALDETAEEQIGFSSFGIYLQPALGALYDIAPFRFYFKSGYKFLILQEQEDYNVDTPEIDMSGFFIMSGLSFMLNS